MAKIKTFEQTSAEIELLNGSKRERAERLLEKAQFMDTELMKLQKILEVKGWVEEYQNGATQSGMKKSSEADVYATLTKNYLATMKQLDDMLPSQNDSAGDELLNFIAR